MSAGKKKIPSLIKESTKSYYDHHDLPTKWFLISLVTYYLLKYQLLVNKLLQAKKECYFLMLASDPLHTLR